MHAHGAGASEANLGRRRWILLVTRPVGVALRLLIAVINVPAKVEQAWIAASEALPPSAHLFGMNGPKPATRVCQRLARQLSGPCSRAQPGLLCRPLARRLDYQLSCPARSSSTPVCQGSARAAGSAYYLAWPGSCGFVRLKSSRS